MKTKFNYLLLTLAATFTVLFANARTTDLNIDIKSGDSQTVNVDYGNDAKVLLLNVTDQSGNTLYTYQHPEKAQSFDFSKVPDGNYYINVENDKTISTTLVSKKDNAIQINKDYRFVLKPVFQQKDKKLTVYYVNSNRTPVEVDIYDANHNAVYSYTTDDALLQKQFDFSKSAYGVYTVNVSTTDNDRNYSVDVDNRN